MSTDPTRRFSDRVEHYVRTRPRYPQSVLDVLGREAGLTPGAVVADLGSGTGISCELFLRNGNQVYGVEPNPAMRQAAEALLGGFSRFVSVAGTAEGTGLEEHSVDYVVAAQAFHWFDVPRMRAEAVRILRSPGWGVLLWNTRRTGANAFMRAYEALLQEHGTDYRQVRHEDLGPDALGALFASGKPERRVLPNGQSLDLEGLKGRLRSSSYTPAAGDVAFPAMMAAAERLFEEHQESGEVRIDYDTELYFGRVDGD